MSIRGVAESRLNCERPSMAMFPTWPQAKAYYTACFKADSVHIREPLPVQTPIHSPVRKKQKFRNDLSPFPRQPNLAPEGPLSHNHLHHEILAATHRSLAPVSHNHLHHEISTPTHRSLAPQASSTPTPSPQIFVPRSCRIIFEDSSDDSVMATPRITDTKRRNQLPYKNLHALPVLTSSVPVEFNYDPSLPVEFNHDPPTIDDAAKPVVIVLDSEEEELPPVKSDAAERDLKCPSVPPNAQCFASSSALTVEASLAIVIPDSDEEFEFEPDTLRELNRLYCVQKPGPPPRYHRRL